jgi:hypothetical protein
MTAEAYARHPEQLGMREVEVDGRILVPPLLDPETVPTRAIADRAASRCTLSYSDAAGG